MICSNTYKDKYVKHFDCTLYKIRIRKILNQPPLELKYCHTYNVPMALNSLIKDIFQYALIHCMYS